MKIKKKMQSVPAIFSGVLLAVAVACQSGPDDHQLKKLMTKAFKTNMRSTLNLVNTAGSKSFI